MKVTQPSIPALRALGEVFDELDEARAAETHGPPLRIQVLGASVLALAALTALTPPGQALAERFGELTGIGDEPREEGNYGEGPIVIGVGETPRHHPYEIVVSGEPGEPSTCVFLGFVEVPGTGMGSCLGAEVAKDLPMEKLSPVIYRAPEGLLPDGGAVIQGLAAADVARVEISYRAQNGTREEVPVEMSSVRPDLLEELGLSDPEFRFFVAFVPPGAFQTPTSNQTAADLQHIDIRAFDADGVKLADEKLDEGEDAVSDEVWLDHEPLGELPPHAITKP